MSTEGQISAHIRVAGSLSSKTRTFQWKFHKNWRILLLIWKIFSWGTSGNPSPNQKSAKLKNIRNEQKNLIFSTQNPTNFRPFFTVQRNKITQYFFCSRFFSNDSRRSDLRSEVSFPLLDWAKKKTDNKFSQIISDNEFLDVFLVGDFRSVWKFCHFFWGILKRPQKESSHRSKTRPRNGKK